MRNLEKNDRHGGCTQDVNDAEKLYSCCNVNEFFAEYTVLWGASCRLLSAKSM